MMLLIIKFVLIWIAIAFVLAIVWLILLRRASRAVHHYPGTNGLGEID